MPIYWTYKHEIWVSQSVSQSWLPFIYTKGELVLICIPIIRVLIKTIKILVNQYFTNKPRFKKHADIYQSVVFHFLHYFLFKKNNANIYYHSPAFSMLLQTNRSKIYISPLFYKEVSCETFLWKSQKHIPSRFTLVNIWTEC